MEIPVILVKQDHHAKRAGRHTDWRLVVDDKAYSWATKKPDPKVGEKLLLWEQPVHDAAYALSKRVEIPDGQYGAGVTKLVYAQKGSAKMSKESMHLRLGNGDEYLIRKTPRYGDKAWLLVKTAEEGVRDDKDLDKLIHSMLVSRPIRSSQAEKAYQALRDRGLTGMEGLRGVALEDLQRTLKGNGYGRFDIKTSNILKELSREDYPISLPRKHVGPVTMEHYKSAGVPERHKYKEIKGLDGLLKIPDPVGSKKYDGAAFWIGFDQEGKPHFVSRRVGVDGKPIERTRQLPHLADVRLPQYAGHLLYSELIHTGHDAGAKERHNVLSAILNSGLDKSLARQQEEGPIRVRLTDVRHPDVGTFGEKRELLDRISRDWGKPGLVEPAGWVEGPRAIRDLHDRTKLNDDEGIIVTSDSLPEADNPRYKVKHTGTYNLRVSGLQQEVDIHGVPKESMGGLHLVDATNREVSTVGTGFTRAEREHAWKNPHEWVGKVVQVKALPPTANRLRAPVYNGEADGEVDTI